MEENILVKTAEKFYELINNNYRQSQMKIELNAEQGKKIFEQAFNGNSIHDMYALAICYQHGIGTPTDIENAARSYLKAAENGCIPAQLETAVCYKCAKGFEQDDKKAIHWLTKAAKQDDAFAQYNLGVVYLKGDGVKMNTEIGIEWLKKSGELGYLSSQYVLGLIYERGLYFTKVDYKEAFYWYYKAANQGDYKSQLAIGDFYNEGKCVARDGDMAFGWYVKARETKEKNGTN